MANIGIDIYEKAQTENKDKTENHTCEPGSWTTVHWKGYLKDGTLVTDSRQELDGLPKTFALGSSEVFKCWDLAT